MGDEQPGEDVGTPVRECRIAARQLCRFSLERSSQVRRHLVRQGYSGVGVLEARVGVTQTLAREARQMQRSPNLGGGGDCWDPSIVVGLFLSNTLSCGCYVYFSLGACINTSVICESYEGDSVAQCEGEGEKSVGGWLWLPGVKPAVVRGEFLGSLYICDLYTVGRYSRTGMTNSRTRDTQ